MSRSCTCQSPKQCWEKIRHKGDLSPVSWDKVFESLIHEVGARLARSIATVAISRRWLNPLEEVARLVQGHEERPGVDELVGRLYGILFEVGESCFGVGEHVDTSLQAVREGIAENILWMDRAVTEELRRAVDRLGDVLSSGYKRSEKAEAMLRVLSKADGEWAVATRSADAAEGIREGLEQLGLSVPVMQIGMFGAEREYEGIVFPAWPNARRFARFMALGVSSRRPYSDLPV